MQQVHKGFTQWKKKGVRFLTVPAFDRAGGVTCAFSTRIGGVSPKPYDSLNFSRKREPNLVNFIENMRRFGDATGFDCIRAVTINYAHSALLYQARLDDAGRGILHEAVPHVCDGLFTVQAELPLVSFHADCVPLFFYDPKQRAVAVCHAGWRGVFAHITRHAVEALVGLGCRQADILAAVGPCISVCHFEVGEDVHDMFYREFGPSTVQARNGRLYGDLNVACVLDMLAGGLLPQNITVADQCTYENPYLFFSHRRDRGLTGAMAAVILLKDENNL